MKKFMQILELPNFQSGALLLLRLIVGVAFILHGWGKIQAPFSWMPGNSIPGIFQFLAAFSEFGGGIALVLGFLTHIASLGMGFTMAVAVFFHAFINKDPFVSMGGPSFEPALGYLGIAILFFAMGPGKFSLDRIVFGERKI